MLKQQSSLPGQKNEIDTELAKQTTSKYLYIMCAGVSIKLVNDTVEKWNASHPELPAVSTSAGSVELIRDCISGKPCDVLISADDAIIRNMMIPEYADGYRIWASNRIVVAGEDITSLNWEEKLLAEDATFQHSNPYDDPGGYRAVMAIMLADLYKPGLTYRLMNHPGYFGIKKTEGMSSSQNEAKYEFTYYTKAKLSSRNFAELPDIMALSNPELTDKYAIVNFRLNDEITVTAEPIAHAITIPKAATHRKAAKELIKMFLAIDKTEVGFLPLEGVYGEDPLY